MAAGLSYFLMIPVAARRRPLLTGIALGTPVLRLRGDYLAIVTLGFGEIVRIALNNNIFGITNGAAGLPRAGEIVPKPFGLRGCTRTTCTSSCLASGRTASTSRSSANVYWYYIIVLLCLFTIFVVNRLDDSRLGRSWTAMREDEVAAASMGVNITGAKLYAFSLGALWGGIAGITFANFQGFVSPESFTFMESVFVVVHRRHRRHGLDPRRHRRRAVHPRHARAHPRMALSPACSKLIGMQLTGEAQSAISNYRYLVFGLLMVMMMALATAGHHPVQASRARAASRTTRGCSTTQNETLYDAQHDTADSGRRPVARAGEAHRRCHTW